jgi:hypothetical protein
MSRTLAVSAIFSALLASSVASAQVPTPLGPPPGQGQSPGTGGLPQIPPPPGSVTPGQPPSVPPGIGNLPSIPPPGNRPSDPHHPDPHVNNYPSDSWYQDMYNRIYYSNYFYAQVEYVSYNEYYQTGDYDAYNIYVISSYLRYLMQEYYWNAYDQYGHAKYYSWGRATRGDFYYGYYFWIKVLHNYLYEYAYKYYSKHYNWSGYDYYVDYVDQYKVKHHEKHNYFYEAARSYHELALCNDGFDGVDPQALDDTAAYSNEQAAGFNITSADVLSSK